MKCIVSVATVSSSISSSPRTVRARRASSGRSARDSTPRRSRRRSETSGEPVGIDLCVRRRRARPGSLALGDLDEPVGVRRVARADDEHELAARGQRPDRVLAVLGRVADVIRAGPGERREALAQTGDDVRGLIDGQRRLGEEGDPVGIGDLEVVDLVRARRSGAARRRPRPRCPRPPRGPRGRRARRCSRRSSNRRASAWTLLTRGQVASMTVSRLRWASARTCGETPWAEKITVASSGTSSRSSTQTAPRRSSSATTWRLWTICLRM